MPQFTDDMDFDPLDPRFLQSKDGGEVPPPVGRHVSGSRYPTEQKLHALLNADTDEPLGVGWPHAGVIVGNPDGSTRRVFHGRHLCLPSRRRDAHAEIIGPTGTGKTSKGLLNMLASDVADPRRATLAMGLKGEEFPFVSHLLRDTGREVFLIDLDDPHLSLRFNPLATDDASAAHNAIASFAELMVNPQSHECTFWKQCGIGFMFGAWSTGVRSLPAMLDLFSDSSAAVRHLRAADNKAARAALSFIDGGSHNSQTALAELVGWLNPFLNAHVASTTSSHSIDLARVLKPGNVTVIRCQESRLTSLKSVYNLLLQWLIDGAVHAADNRPEGTPYSPVSLYVEDLPAWGAIPALVDRMTTLRSRRIAVTAAIQSIAVLQQAYGRSAAAVESCFTNKIIMAGVDQDDAELFSKMTGDQIVAIDSGQGDSMLLRRNVLQPSEIRSPSWSHFLFGAPTTFILSDVAFQAYLCPAYLRPDLRGALAASKAPSSKSETAAQPRPARGTTSASAKARLEMRGVTDTKGMSPKQIAPLIESAKARCAWLHADPTVRRWWQTLEARRAGRPAKLLHILEELILRDLTLSDLYDAYISRQCATLGIAMLFLDYQTARHQHEQRHVCGEKRNVSSRGPGRNLFDDMNDELGSDEDDR